MIESDLIWPHRVKIVTMQSELALLSFGADHVTPEQWAEFDKLSVRMSLLADQVRLVANTKGEQP